MTGGKTSPMKNNKTGRKYDHNYNIYINLTIP